MDASDGTQLVSSSTHDGANDLPEPPQTQTTAEHSTLRNRKSLRIRPSELLEQHDAQVPVPLKAPALAPSLLQPRPSKMSLFNLFSKPKVEKLRGYAEAGLDTPGAPPRKPVNNVSKADSRSQAQHEAQDMFWQPSRLRSRPSKLHQTKTPDIAAKDTPPAIHREQSSIPYEPPPLFQAYPQAMKQGNLEMSTMTPELVFHKSKSRASGRPQPTPPSTSHRESVTDSASFETRQTIRSVFKPSHGPSSRVDLAKKLFVLVTAGYILQYSESGPADRLPERVLPLGKDSAAFACDLIPGKHFVLQVSQTVDQHGQMVLRSGSILTKFGLRGQTAKRTTSTLLLIMHDAAELDSWMSAIRQEIFVQGGKRARSDSTPKLKPEEPSKVDLKKTPSQSHRYQITRHPSKISVVGASDQQEPDPQAAKSEQADDESDTATMDGIEMEASKLGGPADARERATSDAASTSSSTSPSVGQRQLDTLRDSTRISHSTVNTSATSRTNSLTSSPPSDLSKPSSEGSRESGLFKVPYRSLSSYSLTKRRSAMPVAVQDSQPSKRNTLEALMQHNRQSLQEPKGASPMVGDNTPAPQPVPSPALPSPTKRLSVAQSAPDLKARADRSQRHDSKFQPLAEDGDRPESFVGDLPPPSTWITKNASYRNSLIQQNTTQASPVTDLLHKRNSYTAKALADAAKPAPRIRSSFSLPLKINPQDSGKPMPTRSKTSEPAVSDSTAPEGPIVHTLSAKVDFASRTTISSSYIPPRRSSTAMFPSTEFGTSPSRTSLASARLSLFPSPLPPSAGQTMAARRSSASTTPDAYQPANNTANGTTLRRPTSMQVRADPAPFLASVRNSTQNSLAGQRRASTTTVPIRSLKPSRPVPAVPSIAAPPPDAFALVPPALDEETANRATPHPDRSASPAPGVERPSSRAVGPRRSSRIRSSALPEMDFGIPIVGLGPPAPPPSVPLPQLPPGSRPASPLPPAFLTSPSIAETLNNSSPTRRPSGLGIQITAP